MHEYLQIKQFQIKLPNNSEFSKSAPVINIDVLLDTLSTEYIILSLFEQMIFEWSWNSFCKVFVLVGLIKQ